MKKISNTASPFVMMLVPVFLVIGVLFINSNTEIPLEKHKASASFRMPSLNASIFKVMVKAVF